MEDFVPFEIAKELKEKGFDYKCLFVYNKEQIINPEVVKAFGELSDDGYYELIKEGGGKLDWSFVYIDKYQLIQYRDVLIPREMIKAPTIYQVLKWLRKEKGIHLVIDIDTTGYFFTLNYDIIIRSDNTYTFNMYSGLRAYCDAEQAYLAGIEYVIYNRI